MDTDNDGFLALSDLLLIVRDLRASFGAGGEGEPPTVWLTSDEEDTPTLEIDRLAGDDSGENTLDGIAADIELRGW